MSCSQPSVADPSTGMASVTPTPATVGAPATTGSGSVPAPTPDLTPPPAPPSTASEGTSAVLGLLGPVGLDGVNDLACASPAPPVVLLHGTLSSIAVDFQVLVPALVAAGRCVFGADDGRDGLGPVRDSATRSATVIRQVLAATGAPAVDVVGFSQGGLVLRTALRLDGVGALVDTAVLISPSFHGTTSPLVGAVPAAVCPACADQAAGSALLTELDAGGDLDGRVRYAVAVTSADAVVTPWQRQLPDGPADRVRSVVVDQQCPTLVVRHEDMAREPAVVAWTVAALAARGVVEPTALPC